MKYLYEAHLGGLYTADTVQNYEDTYCEQCGDSDFLLGEACTREEAWEILKDGTDIDGSGGWDYDYVQEFLSNHFE